MHRLGRSVSCTEGGGGGRGWWEQGRDSMYCALTVFGSLSEIAAGPFLKQASYSKVLERLLFTPSHTDWQ